MSADLGAFAYTVTVRTKRESEVAGGTDVNGDGDETDVVRYDQSFGYEASSKTGAPGQEGAPIKVLIAEAVGGRSRARVMAEVAKEALEANLDSPFTIGSPLDMMLNGSFEVDGRLYDGNGNLVPSTELNPPYGNTTGSQAAAGEDCNYYKPAVKIPAEGDIDFSGSMGSTGHVAFDEVIDGETHNVDREDSLSAFRFTPEELLGVAAGALDGYKKAASEVPDFANLSGINYITSGAVPSQISGSGVLIIHNPNFDVKKYDCAAFPSTCDYSYALRPENQPMELRINSNGNFKGIIITDYLIRLNGDFRLLGGLASLSTQQMDIPANGSGWIRWSCQAISEAAEQGAGYSIILLWAHDLGD